MARLAKMTVVVSDTEPAQKPGAGLASPELTHPARLRTKRPRLLRALVDIRDGRLELGEVQLRCPGMRRLAHRDNVCANAGLELIGVVADLFQATVWAWSRYPSTDCASTCTRAWRAPWSSSPQSGPAAAV